MLGSMSNTSITCRSNNQLTKHLQKEMNFNTFYKYLISTNAKRNFSEKSIHIRLILAQHVYVK